MKVAKMSVSPNGAQNILLARLTANEQLRNAAFSGLIRQAMNNDKIKGAEGNLLAQYQAGLM